MTNHETIKALRDALSDHKIIEFAISAGIPENVLHQGMPYGYRDEVIAMVRALTADASDQAPDIGCDCGKRDWRDFYTGTKVTDKICAACNTKHPIEWFVARPAPVGAVQVAASIADSPEYKRMLWNVAQDWTRNDRHIALACFIDRWFAAPAAPIAEVKPVASMSIEYTKGCFFHTNCPKTHFGGISRPIKNEATYSVIECAACGAQGKYPVGAIGERCCELAQPAAEHAKPDPVVMGVAQDEAASGKQAAKHHGDAQSNQALISVTGHFGHRQVATPAPRSDAHAKRADVASERDSFEVYWRKVDLSPSLQYQNRFEINCEGNYLYVETRLAWETWQARGQQAGAVDGEASCR